MVEKILAFLDAFAGIVKLIKEAILGIKLDEAKSQIIKADEDAKQTKNTSEIDEIFKTK